MSVAGVATQVKRSLFGYHVVDSDELLDLKNRVWKELEGWVEGDIAEALLDKNHDSVDT